MSKVKSVSSFDGTSWGTAVPLGADDSNIDITSSTTQPDGSAVSGVTDDSNTALDTSAVIVSSGDTSASAWTKFNRFRKRVANNFSNYISGSLRTAYGSSYGDSDVYAASVLNNYMSNVIGVTGTATGTLAGSTQTVKSAIDSLNSNAVKSISRSGTTFTATRCNNTTFTFTQQDNNTNTTYSFKQANKSVSSVSVSASSTKGPITINCAESGWNILGIGAIAIGGSQSSYISAYIVEWQGASVLEIYVRNYSSSAASINIIASIMYWKTN